MIGSQRADTFPEAMPVTPTAATQTGVAAAMQPLLARRLTSTVSITGLGSIVTMAINTVASIAIARNGGPSGYAVFVAANMLIFISTALCTCGLPLALAKHVAAEEEAGRHEALRRVCATTLIVGVVISLVTGFILSANVPRLETYLNISIGRGFAVALPLILLCAVTADCVQGIYSGLLRPRAMISISALGSVAMVAYILVRRTGFIELPLWGAVATSYVSSGIVAWCWIWRDKLLGVPAALEKLRPVVIDLLPAAAFICFTVFSSWGDRWIVGTQLGAVAMGTYAAAVVIIQATLRMPTQVAWVLVPAARRVALGGAEKSARLNEAMIANFGLFAALATVVLCLAPSTIMRVLFGAGFMTAAPVLLLMAPSVLASAVSIPLISMLTGSQKNRFVIYLLVLTTVPRLLLLLFFTRQWSITGTAAATVLAECLLAACGVLLGRKRGLKFPLRALARPYSIAVLAYAVGFGALMLGAHQVLAVTLALIVFIPSVWRLVQPVLSAMSQPTSSRHFNSSKIASPDKTCD